MYYNINTAHSNLDTFDTYGCDCVRCIAPYEVSEVSIHLSKQLHQ